MERLTTCPADGKRPCDAALEAMAQLKQIAEIFNCDPNDPAQLKQLCDKLRGWQQAEQAGRLVVLPCKVGDTVYKVAKTIKFYGNGTRIFVCEVEASLRAIFDWVRYGDFGKTVFLTRQEAEAAVESAKTTKEEI